MDGPLLTKSEHNVDDVTLIHGDLSSSNEEHIVHITTHGDSSSADEQTPHDKGVQRSDIFTFMTVRLLFEFIVALVQIVAAIVVLTLTKDEQPPQKTFTTLILGYTGCCIASLPVIGLRFWHYYRSVNSETRIFELVEHLKSMLEYFFVGWAVVLSWHLINNSSSLDNTTQQFWLCMAFLAISCILHVLPNLPCAAVCFLYPMILRVSQSIDFVDDMADTVDEINWTIVAYFGIFAFVIFGICSCCCCCCTRRS